MTAADSIMGGERASGRVDDYGLLFEYALKCLAVSAFLELVLYRLVSRLGMHLSKLAAKYEAIRLLFKGLSSIGFTLLNVVSLLVFLCLSLFLVFRFKQSLQRPLDSLISASVALLLVLTVAFLVLPPSMLAVIAYNVVTLIALIALGIEYVRLHPSTGPRAMMAAFLLGIGSWLYYQTISTVYGYWEILAAAPMAHEVNRAGEALMVLSSILAFWAYAGFSLWTSNKRQRRRALIFTATGLAVFLGLLFLDYVLALYDREVAESVRKAGEGIGWIFQMGMGYTFYLPFAVYVAGLFCWTYAVLRQVSMGRLAGYGLALMFLAGYALQLSHLTLMVVLGLILMNMDRSRPRLSVGEQFERSNMVNTGAPPLVGERI